MRLKDKVVLVTGGGSGIGESIAVRSAEEGAAVVVVDVSADAAMGVAAALEDRGHRATWVVADVASGSAAAEAVARAESSFGRLDVLVNNAGIVRDAQLVNMEEDQWDAVLAVNLSGAYFMCRAAATGMVQRGGGRIVNIASRSLLGNFGQTNYSASKAGIVGLTKSLALELGPSGISVNAIAPGYIETPIMRNVPAEVRKRAVRAAPLRRVGTPDDVASAVTFLASDDASYITGQCLFVCGGRSLASALEMWA